MLFLKWKELKKMGGGGRIEVAKSKSQVCIHTLHSYAKHVAQSGTVVAEKSKMREWKTSSWTTTRGIWDGVRGREGTIDLCRNHSTRYTSPILIHLFSVHAYRFCIYIYAHTYVSLHNGIYPLNELNLTGVPEPLFILSLSLSLSSR